LPKREEPKKARHVYTKEEMDDPEIAKAYELELAANQSRGF
jgi:hypothetical protein